MSDVLEQARAGLASAGASTAQRRFLHRLGAGDWLIDKRSNDPVRASVAIAGMKWLRSALSRPEKASHTLELIEAMQVLMDD